MDLLLLLLRLLMAAALYLFLGAVLLLLWRDLRRHSETEAQITLQRYGRLVVVAVDGADENADGVCRPGTTFPLQPVTSLGRAAINTITIPDAYASVEHALLIHRGGQWWLEDRGSRNGTTLNAATVDGPTIVSAGDVIGIGRVELKLELVDL